MVNIIIDGKSYQAQENSTILEAARANGVAIPTLCYFKGLNEIGACRICLVEVVGMNRLVASCHTKIKEGMEIKTRTPKVQNARKVNVRLILSEHECNCPTCVRDGNCQLQDIAAKLGVHTNPYVVKYRKSKWNTAFPLIREESKCIKCMRCIQVCDHIQGMKVWDLSNTGKRTRVDVRDNQSIEDVNCTLCGQCITHCPVGALRVRNDKNDVWDAIADPEMITVVQVAPAVRTAWAESSGLSREQATPEHLAAALRRIGFDYVFDTTFSADLTIMEEGSELLAHLQNPAQAGKTMFTSCCPGWVRFIKQEYPELVGQLSSAKSPQQMFGAVTKSYFAAKLGVAPEKICCVSIMPCVAKKYECAVPEVNSESSYRDVDIVLTTRELDSFLKMANVDIHKLEPEQFDSPLGEGTGAGVIFGKAGGVMEAALRTAYFLLEGHNPDASNFYQVQEREAWLEGVYRLKGAEVKIATTSGLANTRALLEALRHGRVYYDFVEIMACPGGCSGGGGQPIHDGQELAAVRGQYLGKLDETAAVRFSHENTEVQQLYKEYLGEPLSEKAHHYLHTDQTKWKL